MRRVLFALLLASGLPTPVAVAKKPASDAPGPPPTAVTTPAEATTTDSAVVLAMHRHLTLVQQLHDSVIAGDLEAARSAGRTLNRQPPIAGVPENWRPWLVQIKESASRVEDAWDLDTAARTAAEIGRTCASCHRANAAGPTFPDASVPPPSKADGVKAHMQHHRDAAQLMWEGLIAGDDQRYTIGANGLAHAALSDDDAAQDGDEAVHKLAEYGARVKGLAARADTYGALLAQCARCHAQQGVGPGKP